MTISITIFGKPSRKKIPFLLDVAQIDLIPKEISTPIGLLRYASYIYDPDDPHRTDAWDRGSHTVCAVMTSEFLEYTKSMGNDLSTPRFDTRHTFLPLLSSCANM